MRHLRVFLRGRPGPWWFQVDQLDELTRACRNGERVVILLDTTTRAVGLRVSEIQCFYVWTPENALAEWAEERELQAFYDEHAPKHDDDEPWKR